MCRACDHSLSTFANDAPGIHLLTDSVNDEHHVADICFFIVNEGFLKVAASHPSAAFNTKFTHSKVIILMH